MAVTAAGMMILVIVGGLIGRVVYQVIERPREVVVYIDRSLSRCNMKPTDRIELVTASTSDHLAWPLRIAISTTNPDASAVVFEVNRKTPDFNVVDPGALWNSGEYSYADVVAAGGTGLSIDGCVERRGPVAELRAVPLFP